MRFLYTLGELLTMRSNGWSCSECGKAWADLRGPSLAVPIADGYDPTCRHPRIARASIAPQAVA